MIPYVLYYYQNKYPRMRSKYPPDEFELRKDSEFRSFRLVEPQNKLEGALLVHVDESAKLTGSYKFVLGGSELVKTDIPANNLVITGGSASYRKIMETWPADIKIRENMMTSSWLDLDER
jgi:hypothetical protein